MPLDPVFDRCFGPLNGKPCWQARRGHGSFITLEFGEPSLEIREPSEPKADASYTVRKLLSRRLVTIRGQWHLWVYCCAWTIFNNSEQLAHSEDNDEAIASAIGFLDGQALIAATVDNSANSQFTFDLGGVLTTSPYDEDSEQWMLYQPDGMVLSLRADGHYSHSTSFTEHGAERWLPAWKP